MLFAQRHGIFRPYHDTVFKRFWNHELELDELAEITGMVFNGELFWGGDRIPLLIERIRAPETAEIALGKGVDHAADWPS